METNKEPVLETPKTDKEIKASKLSLKTSLSFVALALLGLADSVYLLIEHVSPSKTCLIPSGDFFARFADCGAVLASSYSEIFGIPLALLGVLYYSLIFALVMIAIQTGVKKIFNLALYITPAGFLASMWFVYIQAVILEAYCLYCLGSAITSTLLFLFGMIILMKQKRPVSKVN